MICHALGLYLEDVMQANIDKLKKRYPNGFQERTEKEISLLKPNNNYDRLKNMSIDEMAIALASIAGIPSPCDLCDNSVDDDNICMRDDNFCCDINHRKSLMRQGLMDNTIIEKDSINRQE